MTYYAVCNVGGPISVELAGATRGEAIASFDTLDGRAAIDAASTDIEDKLELDIEGGATMTEVAFAAAIKAAGARWVADLSPIHNAHAGTVAHLADGWTLWMVPATPTVNERGLAEIKDFLSANHRKGDNFSVEMLRAWAADAEFQLGEGNPATIELRPVDSVHGRTLEYTISPAGLDVDASE